MNDGSALSEVFLKPDHICERVRMTDGWGSQWSIFNPGVGIT